MSDTVLKEQLADRFGPQVTSDELLLRECVQICQLYNLSAEELQYKWEAFSFSGASRTVTIFTLESAALLKANIQRNLASEKVKKEERAVRNLSGVMGGGGRAMPKFGNAKMGGMLKVKGEPRVNSSLGPSRVAFKGPSVDEESRKTRSYKYMYEKVSERSEVLDERIDEFAEITRRYYKIPDFSDPSASTEDRVYVIGRITLDAESSSTGAVKLNEASLVLESSRLSGSGARVLLKFHTGTKARGSQSGSTGTGFFPGAIVAFKGKNGGGGWFLVDEILMIPPLTPPVSVKSEGGLGSFTMCIACGPFTPDTDLQFKPWHTLIQKLKAERPAVLLLIGPFIDSAHPSIRTGDVDDTPLDIFRRQIKEHVCDFLDLSPGSIAVLVPSVRDVISDHAVYPQSEFSRDVFADPRVHLVPNPCQFAINGVKFAASSVDVLFHLRKEEFFKTVSDTSTDTAIAPDPMASTCRHLLHQRSFYPIFPVPVDHTSEVNLDVTHSEVPLRLGGDEALAPDVLVVPSRLKHFSKVVDGTTAINPSFVSKGHYTMLSFDAGAAGSDRLNVENLKLE